MNIYLKILFSSLLFSSLLFSFSLIILIFFLGFYVGRAKKSSFISQQMDSMLRYSGNTIAGIAKLDSCQQVMLEYPELIGRILEGAKFGNDQFSIEAAQHMFGDHPAAVNDILDKTVVEQISDHIWVIRMPIVNASVIDTDDGLVIIDTGMKPAGPALRDFIRTISSKPIHTIIYARAY